MSEADSTAAMRVCKSCGSAKPLEKFSRADAKEKGHRRRTCTACLSSNKRKRAKELGLAPRRNRIREYLKRKNATRGLLCAEQLHAAKKRAQEAGQLFLLNRSDIVIPDYCPLLGIPLFKCAGRAGPNSPSLDRIDPVKGYVPDNVWVISWRANQIKRDATLQELKQIVAGLEKRLSAALS